MHWGWMFERLDKLTDSSKVYKVNRKDCSKPRIWLHFDRAFALHSTKRLLIGHEFKINLAILA